MSKRQCEHCGVTGRRYKTCANCRVARYCCAECQRADWGAHRHLCDDYAKTKPFKKVADTLFKHYLSILQSVNKAVNTPCVFALNGAQLDLIGNDSKHFNHIIRKLIEFVNTQLAKKFKVDVFVPPRAPYTLDARLHETLFFKDPSDIIIGMVHDNHVSLLEIFYI